MKIFMKLKCRLTRNILLFRKMGIFLHIYKFPFMCPAPNRSNSYNTVTLEKPLYRKENKRFIEICLQEIGWGSVGCVLLSQVTDKYLAAVASMVVDLQFP
jgi:hypothetical protein